MTQTIVNPNALRQRIAANGSPTLLHHPATHRVRWTVEAAMMLVEAGIIEASGYELLDGELVEKMKNRPHLNGSLLVLEWVQRTFPARCYQFEGPVTVAAGEVKTNLPEPDVTVLRRPFLDFTSSNPTPDDVLLLIEVSDTTLNDDLDFKAGLYARAGYAEYWVLDIPNRRLHVHRNPADGEYSVVIYDATTPVAPLAAPEASFVTAKALPPL